MFRSLTRVSGFVRALALLAVFACLGTSSDALAGGKKPSPDAHMTWYCGPSVENTEGYQVNLFTKQGVTDSCTGEKYDLTSAEVLRIDEHYKPIDGYALGKDEFTANRKSDPPRFWDRKNGLVLFCWWACAVGGASGGN